MMPPAAMPSEEEIKDILLRFHADTASAWRHERDGIATFAARAILALFAPILAEKERQLASFRQYVAMHRARALAAEAALAAERERCAKVVEFITDPDQDAGSFDPKHCQNVASDAFNDHPARATMNARLKSYGAAIAASIRAQGE